MKLLGKKDATLKHWLKYYYNYNLYCFKQYFEKINQESRIFRTEEFLQHGTTSRYLHSLAVAYYSYVFAILLGKRDHLGDLVRGALSHDYFLYDSKSKIPERHGHGKNHPKIALKNAEQDFILTDIERDIILKHMFPLTLTPPKYKESLIVSLVDKWCAIYEFFIRKNPYPTLSHGILGKTYADLENIFLTATVQEDSI